MSACTALSVNFGLNWFLIPRYGIMGAGIALFCGQLVGCLTYAMGGRRLYAMPVSFPDLIGITACAIGGYLGCRLLNHLVPIRGLSVGLDLIVLALAFAVATRLYDLFGLGKSMSMFWRRHDTATNGS